MAFVEESRSKFRFSSMPNFRQLGAEILDENGKNKSIKIYRSSRPDFLTETEAYKFKELGIRSIIDFRSAREYKKANGTKLLDHFFPVYKVKLPFYGKYNVNQAITYKPLKTVPNVEGLATLNGDFNANAARYENGSQKSSKKESSESCGRHYLINFFKMNYIFAVFNRAPWYLKLYSMLYLFVDVVLNTGYRYFVRLFARQVLNKAGLVGQYIDMIQLSQNQIYVALKLLCDPNNVPAMMNCAHGKDRTGIVSALVLACFGAPKETIALDYAKSEVELEPMKHRLHEEIVKKFHMCETFTSAKASNMMDVLNHIETEYGSLTDYLEYIGFTAEDQAKLRQNLSAACAV